MHSRQDRQLQDEVSRAESEGMPCLLSAHDRTAGERRGGRELDRMPTGYRPVPCAIGQTRAAVDARYDRAGGEGRW